MATLPSDTLEHLKTAYEAGLTAITDDPATAHVPPESYEALAAVEAHRWFWRPKEPGLILIAESHVYTSDADLGVRINEANIAPLLPPGHGLPPCVYVGLVYCLGYGEVGLLQRRHPAFRTRGTWQYWDVFGRIAGTGNQPRARCSSLEERLRWKIETLNRLMDLGVWLLDASIHAIYIGSRVRRSPACCKALHRQWWQHYGSHVVGECDNPIVWVIGAAVHRHLNNLKGFRSEGFIYQPNARNVDKEYNWDRLLADVANIQGFDPRRLTHVSSSKRK